LQRLLEARGIGCSVVEPVGYPQGQDDDAGLITRLDAAVKQLSTD
jgi:hypothetical protein